MVTVPAYAPVLAAREGGPDPRRVAVGVAGQAHLSEVMELGSCTADTAEDRRYRTAARGQTADLRSDRAWAQTPSNSNAVFCHLKHGGMHSVFDIFQLVSRIFPGFIQQQLNSHFFSEMTHFH